MAAAGPADGLGHHPSHIAMAPTVFRRHDNAIGEVERSQLKRRKQCAHDRFGHLIDVQHSAACASAAPRNPPSARTIRIGKRSQIRCSFPIGRLGNRRCHDRATPLATFAQLDRCRRAGANGRSRVGPFLPSGLDEQGRIETARANLIPIATDAACTFTARDH